MGSAPKENWGSGGPYEHYVGRWSRRVGREFLAWLQPAPGLTWGDVGCGTGALVEGILSEHNPQNILAIDRSEGFVAAAKRRISDSRVRFDVGDATKLPWPDRSLDVTVSGLVLNFVSDVTRMATEMTRVTRPLGKVGAYVWDYAAGMQMMRNFWDVAIELSPDNSAFDQAERFPICQPEALESLFQQTGLTSVSARPIDIPTIFRDFDDYWNPFLGKQGAAPTYLASLSKVSQHRIRDALRARLPISSDGSIGLTARAWAVKGILAG
jgi:SAM-dependent methyltransferase